MHINHLIWDRIFTDPEFGGLDSFKKDPYGCTSYRLYRRDFNVTTMFKNNTLEIARISEWNNQYRPSRFPIPPLRKEYNGSLYRYKICRGIHVHVPDRSPSRYIDPIPSLQMMCAMVLAKTRVAELRSTVIELTNVMLMEKDNFIFKMNASPHDDYMCNRYIHSISKDVYNEMNLYLFNLYRLDINYHLPHFSQRYLEDFKFADIIFRGEIRFLMNLGTNYDIDILRRNTPDIEYVWSLVIDIFQIYNQMMNMFIKDNKSPIRSKYYDMYRCIRKSVHIQNRYQ